MTPIEKLIALDKEKRLKIAVCGDSMTDRYIHGRLGSCQEDAMKFVEERSITVAGGAANAQRQFFNWNCATALFCQHPAICPVKTRFLVNGKFVFRHDVDEMDCEPVLKERRKTEFAKLADGKPDAILISDYDKGFLTPELISKVIDLANERKIPCVADAKRHPRFYEGCTLKGNHEYEDKFGGISVYEFHFEGIVFTRGGKPPVLFPHHGDAAFAKHSVTVANHVGAGDCFAAHLTLALAHGLSLVDAASIAHSAGRVYVQKEHNEPPTPDEVRRDMMQEGKCGVKYHRSDCECKGA